MTEFKCTLCEEVKQITEFYKNKLMKDGYAKQCKKCVTKRAKERHYRLSESKEWCELERLRSKEKYHRLNYCDKYRGTHSHIKNYSLYKQLHKRLLSKNLIDSTRHVHHWNYNLVNDFFVIDKKMHRRVHPFLTLDLETLCFKTIDGELLDNRWKHAAYIYKIIDRLNSKPTYTTP